MTIKDYLYLFITIASWALAVIAGVYAHNKQKINRATKLGQVLDAIGKVATFAVHEAEFTGMDNEAKREYASEIISQALKVAGLSATPQVINGAIEQAVNGMHLANQSLPQTSDATAETVPENDILKPSIDAESAIVEPSKVESGVTDHE
ncbi:hypothetical protein FC52_GL000293 [Lactobacillus pasteurii DSM 23907 = CRBIP 24.76]|uniref:ORF107 n=1 Tax=Lactobacillus pasteurii DSM 23907 = CRBIP 24.76 TaxID=1423790 RepID=I7LBF8_9LACO|nr:phage holin [Lactobacillus pasteurii]KRK08595.1 hypothetical protein FC52_GL000293 [Lactobacillus pasteurii DSM 23907 = CRBIP 24.76]TDG75776.1 hypothetical protein C5L33_000661 [Lactobacillus pasteurii]CCI85541.1 ORF107 [Lactobacillus pasteurii DSM 23907 = CRBIP 24.76]